ncbi:misacylated tRNA(Ala) deacylase [Azospirillum fermentarium]|uniref:alanyl-tRNA editing protein n=1 Tax=Azospirillum fermentarium TaxID=1233114 RepID=UPI0022278D0B|nr:alanyl-tRNA editing protein [Azospirillum fermentarium]MCW2246540.1 misacylated tRNA(Ala) deacylase [Azospirillum fermentarium]
MELLFRDDAYTRTCTATVVSADETGIRLDRTVFYPTGGGQPGDTGVLRAGGVEIPIIDTVKGGRGPDDVLHIPAAGVPLPAPGTAMDAEIDWERRYRHMRMHTALHLLCAVVPGSVTGGQIAADKSRLDFNVPTASLDKDAIAAAINRIVAGDIAVATTWISDEELAANPELVRTMSVKPPSGSGRVRVLSVEGVDLQPCGGTHVARTGEIGTVEVVKIENKGKQNRRVIIALTS